jgi:aspartyl-tRNA(Asn)/glutamyl-tRNA(Gln) amidotransferase subunit A
MDIYKKSITELSDLLHKKSISSLEMTNYFIERIKSFDNELNSFITVDEESAKKQAINADSQIAKKNNTFLTGIPIAHKDLFSTKGMLTTCASKMLEKYIPPFDATVVSNLDNLGMVKLGKTNMDEFAMGSSNESSYFGPVKNPWDTSKVPGGSSGGSASAVAARLTPIATGSDTGGSIRQPASFCGLTGLKPTYGSVSRYGMIAYASSLDQGGPIGKSAEDCRILYDQIKGYDRNDPTSNYKVIQKNSNPRLSKEDAKKITIGIPKEYFSKDLDKSISDSIFESIKQFEKIGFNFKDISLPNHNLAIPAYYIIASAEASSNLSRYDGIKFGHRCSEPKNLEDLYLRTRKEGFGTEVKKRIMIGAYALSSGYYDEYYMRALKIRRIIRDNFTLALKQVDYIFAPTSPSIAFNIGEKTSNATEMYLSDIYTTPVNLSGLPAISIPIGFSNNLPIGMQIIGNYFSEHNILDIANLFQKETDWHARIPEKFNHE